MNKKDDTGKITNLSSTIADYPMENKHATPELAPVIRYCRACLQNRTRNIYGRCIVCNSELKAVETFAETVSIIEELRDEFIFLESIRQTAFELCALSDKYIIKSHPEFIEKLEELKHLVSTD